VAVTRGTFALGFNYGTMLLSAGYLILCQIQLYTASYSALQDYKTVRYFSLFFEREREREREVKMRRCVISSEL